MSDEKDLIETSEEEKQKENKNKVKKAFENNITTLTAVIGKEPPKKKRKVEESALDSLMADLFKEEDEDLQKEFKKELKELLSGYITLNEEIEKKRKEVDQVEEQKYKEFNEKASKLWRRIDNLPARLKKFGEAFKKAAEAAMVKPPEKPAP